MRIRRAITALAVLTAIGTLTACSQDPTEPGPDNTQALSGQPADVITDVPATKARARLTRANYMRVTRDAPADLSSMHFTATMRLHGMRIEGAGDMVLGRRSTKMTMSVVVPSVGPGQVDLRYVGGKVYVSVSGAMPTGRFVEIDPRDASDPLARNFSQLPEASDPVAVSRGAHAVVRRVRLVGADDVEGVEADHYAVEMDTAWLLQAMGLPVPPGTTGTSTFHTWLDGRRLPLRSVVKLPGMSMDMSMSRWGEPLSITAPRPEQLLDRTTLMPPTA